MIIKAQGFIPWAYFSYAFSPSLRFVLLALTIFLIVFGVGVKYWKKYEEHTIVVGNLRDY